MWEKLEFYQHTQNQSRVYVRGLGTTVYENISPLSSLLLECALQLQLAKSRVKHSLL